MYIYIYLWRMAFKYILYIIYLNIMYIYIACKTISYDIPYY